jgi:peroxiredoxin Q/BCP
LKATKKVTNFRARLSLWLGLAAALTILGGVAARAADVEVGQPAPDFRLPDQDNHLRSLADYKGKILILAFYPKDFTGG